MPRRFIAGAVCPRCGAQDKIVVDTETDTRECVSCGFSDLRPQESPVEPATRVNRPAARLVETTPEAVRLVEPGQSNPSGPSDSDER